MQRTSKIKYLLIFFLFSTKITFSQNDNEWKIWVKTSPCSGRHDWISVAKEYPGTGGLGYFELANNIFPQTLCTTFGCTFADATAIANSLKTSDDFFDYCCREYSVWENSQTRARTVFLGKFGTAGPGWLFLKGDLCCEEAETLAGIPNACSGREKVECWPGSYAAWNPQSQRTECFCNPGLVWNADKTACVSNPIPDCPNIYDNSYTAWDASTSQYMCYCNQGFVWNSTRTACVTNQIPDCPNIYDNSYAAWDANTSQYMCYCNQGFVWNSTRTACVTNQIPDCPNIYDNSYAAWDANTSQYMCYCNQGFVWNSTRTACVSSQIPDCPNIYANSEALWDAVTSQYLCYCKQSYEWNATRTACVALGGGNRDNPQVKPQQQKNGECNIEYKSGANEPEQYTIDVKRNYGSLNFSYNTHSVKDRIHIYHGGAKVFDSGCVGTSGSQTLALNGSSSVFTIIVDPLCDPTESNTAWDFTLGCPN